MSIASNTSKTMRILITGVAGYLGSVTATFALRAGHEVRGVDSLLHGGIAIPALSIHDGFEFVHADIRDELAMAKSLDSVDAVVHLAAIVGDPACAANPNVARSVNETASIQLIKQCRDAGVRRFTFASTCSNYGRMVDNSVLATERFELRPVSLYAETKVAIERHLLESPADPTFTPTVLRFATLFGISPRMRFDLTVNEFVMRVLSSRQLVVYGEQFWRPYVHVRDAARAILSIIKSDASEIDRQVFNVGDTSENYTKADLVRIIREQLGEFHLERVSRTEDPRDYRVCFDRIRERFGFQITRSVSQGINEIAEAISIGILDPLDDPRKYNAAAA